MKKEMLQKIDILIDSAVEFLAMVKREGQTIRKESKEKYGRLLDAHMLVLGAIKNATKRKDLDPGRSSDSISTRLLLSTSFLQGVDLCECAITEGLYIQAAALLKQELETLAAMEECKLGSRQERKTPNVKHAKWDLGAMYGELNKLSHVADKLLLQNVLHIPGYGEAKPASLAPVYIKNTSRMFYGLHVALLTQIALQIHELYEEMYGDGLNEIELFGVTTAFDFLIDEKWLTRHDVK